MKSLAISFTDFPPLKRRGDLLISTGYTDCFAFPSNKTNDKPSISLLKRVKLLMKVLSGRADVLHILDFEPLYLPILIQFAFLILFRIKFRKIIFDTGDSKALNVRHYSQGNPLTFFLSDKLEKFILRKSDIVVVRGKALETWVKSVAIHQLVKYIPDSVDVEFYNKVSKSAARQRLGLPDGYFIVGYGGGMHSVVVGGDKLTRGWELIEVVSELKALGAEDVLCLYIGLGNGITNLKREVENRGLSDYFIFTGGLSEEIYSLYMSAIDVGFREDYDTPNYRLNIGIKVQEYMAAGCAIVTGRNIDRDYMLSPSQGNELFFEPLKIPVNADINRYIGDVTRIFSSLYNERLLVKQLGESNRTRAKELFDSSRILTCLSDLYKYEIF